MPSWWDSPDTLANITTWLRIGIVVFGVLTAAATALTIATGNRADWLRAQERRRLTERLGEAEQRTAQAQERAAEAERRAAEAAKRTAPRVLSDEQAAKLIAALVPLRGRPLEVLILTNDGEAFRFGQQIVAALGRAGLQLSVMQAGTVSRGSPTEGLILSPGTEAARYADALEAAFSAAGLAVSRGVTGSVAPDRVHLTVGQRPTSD